MKPGETGMPEIAGVGLAASLVLAATLAVAQAEQIDPQHFDALLAAARSYAQDRSLIFYCLRGNEEMVPFLYAGLHFDIADAVQRLRAAGSDDRQNALLIEAVLSHVRFAAAAAQDPLLDQQCAAKDVEKNLEMLQGVGVPLAIRPPFDALKP
jgi:hypothetical protein